MTFFIQANIIKLPKALNDACFFFLLLVMFILGHYFDLSSEINNFLRYK